MDEEMLSEEIVPDQEQNNEVEENSSGVKNFVLILYPDSTSYDFSSVISKLKDAFNQYAYIPHDKCIDDLGEVKKLHYHIVGKTNNQTSTHSIAKKLGIQENYVQIAKAYKRAVRYLAHVDNPEKFQYDIGDITANWDYRTYFAKEISEKKQAVIIKFVLNSWGVTLEQVVRYCLENNLYSELRRGYSIIRDLVKERNEFMKAMREKEKESKGE